MAMRNNVRLRPGPVLGAARMSGRSSGVEHNLAKVRVVSSNLIARSKISLYFRELMRLLRIRFSFVDCWVTPSSANLVMQKTEDEDRNNNFLENRLYFSRWPVL